MNNRREFIRKCSLGSGAFLLTGYLNQLCAAESITYRPKRFIFFLQTNGMYPNQIQPPDIKYNKRASSLTDKSMDGIELSESLSPLTPFKDRMTVIQGLSGRICGGGHSNDFSALGCFPNRRTPLGETIDAALAKKLPSVFSHVGLGVVDKNEHSVVYNVSAWAAGKKLPTQCQPLNSYKNLFGVAAGPKERKSFDARTNVLDFLADDVKKLSKEVSGSEKEKLDQYLDAFENMSNRQQKLIDASARIKKAAPGITEKFKSDGHWLDRLQAQCDNAAGALIAGLTNVVTLSSCSGNAFFGANFDGSQLGFDAGRVNQHGMGHGGSFVGKKSDELFVALRKRHMEMLASLLKKLESIPEGNGNMLDNTVVVFTSDSAEGHHSRCWEWPMVMIGSPGGRKIPKGGRFMQFPWHGNKGHRTTSNLYTSLLHSVGDHRSRFGMQDLSLKDIPQDGVLEEIM